MQGWNNIHKSINVIHAISKMKDKNFMIISIDAKKHLTKSSRVGIEETYLNVMKAIYDKSTANNILNREKVKHFL